MCNFETLKERIKEMACFKTELIIQFKFPSK